MDVAEKAVRGSVINGYLKYVEKTWGKDGLEDCKKAINIKGMKIKEAPYYSNEIMLSLLKWISGNHGIGRVRQAGNFTVKNLGLLSYLVRFASMEKMISKATDRFREVYAFGDITVEQTDKGALVQMRGVCEIPESCEGWQGAFEAMLELTKSKGRVVKTKCETMGEGLCEYSIEWKS
jgi:hypothetical protein